MSVLNEGTSITCWGPTEITYKVMSPWKAERMQYLPKLKQLLNHRMYLKLGVSGYQTSYKRIVWLQDSKKPIHYFIVLLCNCVSWGQRTSNADRCAQASLWFYMKHQFLCTVLAPHHQAYSLCIIWQLLGPVSKLPVWHYTMTLDFKLHLPSSFFSHKKKDSEQYALACFILHLWKFSCWKL